MTAPRLLTLGTATPHTDGTAAVGTATAVSHEDHVHPTDTTRAALASPTFTGVPAAPTAAPGTNTTQLATTAFVAAASGGGGTATISHGTLASRPSASGNNNALYYATDARPKFPTAAGQGVLYISNGTSWLSVSRALSEEMGWYNVLDYGMDPTGTTDNSSIMSSIIALLDTNRAGTIYLPQGKYIISATCTIQGATFVGEAQTGASTIARGSTQWIVPDSSWGLIVGDAANTHWRGYRIENLDFYEKNAGGALGGLKMLRVCDSNVTDSNFGDFTAGTPLWIDGTGDNSQYNQVTRCRFGRGGTYSYRQTATNGTVMSACYFEGNNGQPPPADGRIARYLESGDTFRSYGDRLQGFQYLDVVGTNLEHRITDVRYENWKTAALHVLGTGSGARRCSISGTGDNSQGGNAGTGVIIDSGAADTDLTGLYIENVQTQITDNGTRTIYKRSPFISNAGPVGDANYAISPQDGVFAYDSTNNHVQLRVGGAWNYINVDGGLTPIISRIGLLGSHNIDSTSQTTVTRAVTRAVPAGHHVIVGVGYGLSSTVTVTVTDARSNSYATDVHADKLTNNTPHAVIASSKIATPLQVGDLITVTFSSAVNHPAMTTVEYANLATASWLDQTAGATGASTAPSSGNITTTVAQSVAIGVMFWDLAAGANTLESGWNLVSDPINDSVKSLLLQDKQSFSTATLAATGTLASSGDWAMAVADYKSA